MICVQSKKRALAKNRVKEAAFLLKNPSKEFVLPPNSEKIEIEAFVAKIWQEIAQKHIPEMLEDLESLRFVPLKVKKSLAESPMFLVRYE